MKNISEICLGEEVMMIDPLQDPVWDEFVDNHPYGWITHLSGWKRVLEKSFKQLQGRYLVLLNDDQKGYRAALPIYEVNSWLTGKRLVSIPFATLSDPLVSDKEELRALLKASCSLRAYLKCASMEIRSFNTLSMIDDSLLAEKSLYKHHYIELERDLEVMKSRFHRSCVRQRINRALQSGINLIEGTEERHMKEFYRLYLRSRKRLSLPPQPYDFIKSMWETFSPSGRLALLLAEHNGQFIAGMILFKYKKRVSTEYAVLDETYQNISPNHFLFWEAIRSAIVEGYSVFDFGRTDPENANLMEFKSRWGTKVADIRFFQRSDMKNISENKERSKAYNMVKRICSRTPDPIFQMIGNFCYRHIS